jgi:hypothetical protein
MNAAEQPSRPAHFLGCLAQVSHSRGTAVRRSGSTDVLGSASSAGATALQSAPG